MNRRYLAFQGEHGSQRGNPPVVVDTANILPGNRLLAGTAECSIGQARQSTQAEFPMASWYVKRRGAIHPPAEDRGLSRPFSVKERQFWIRLLMIPSLVAVLALLETHIWRWRAASSRHETLLRELHNRPADVFRSELGRQV